MILNKIEYSVLYTILQFSINLQFKEFVAELKMQCYIQIL